MTEAERSEVLAAIVTTDQVDGGTLMASTQGVILRAVMKNGKGSWPTHPRSAWTVGKLMLALLEIDPNHVVRFQIRTRKNNPTVYAGVLYLSGENEDLGCATLLTKPEAYFPELADLRAGELMIKLFDLDASLRIEVRHLFVKQGTVPKGDDCYVNVLSAITCVVGVDMASTCAIACLEIDLAKGE